LHRETFYHKDLLYIEDYTLNIENPPTISLNSCNH